MRTALITCMMHLQLSLLQSSGVSYSEANAQLKANFDQLVTDNAEQRTNLGNALARAGLEALNQKNQFDNQMAKAVLDAGNMKVKRRLDLLMHCPVPAYRKF